MNPEKLESLRRLAADPRTPEEEARTAALLYVRNAGVAGTVSQAEHDELKNLYERTAVELRESLAANRAAATARHNAEKIAEDARKSAERATAIVARMKDVLRAEELAREGRAEIEKQIRAFESTASTGPVWGVVHGPPRTPGGGDFFGGR